MEKGYHQLSTFNSGKSGYTQVSNPQYYNPSPTMAHDFNRNLEQGYNRSPSPYPPSVNKARRQERYAGSYPGRSRSRASCSVCDCIIWLIIIVLVAVAIYCHVHASSVLSTADNCPTQCVNSCYNRYPLTSDACDLSSCDSQCNPQAAQAKTYLLASIGTIIASVMTTLIVLCIRVCPGFCSLCYRDSCCAIY
ncbi:hypothetical protein BGW37DRAFT_492380 [Umbelopsis sp. PMI_123]|nr:hypothetical protein BGW37DRAFT_492380 [Umbelopsis sp. PMI_123]